MNFTPAGKMFKLIDTENALMIVDMSMNVKGGNPLMAGGVGDIITYLDRYFYEREHGLSLQDAHERAVETCGFTQQLDAAVGRSPLPPFPLNKT